LSDRRAIKIKTALLLGAWVAAAPAALAGSMTIHVGPPSVGTGGSNPLSVPPINPMEYELTYLTDGDYEINAAVTPGLLFGRRSHANGKGGLYVSFGGGLVIDANGSGPGAYSAFGWESAGKWRFNIEYKQALGYDFSKDNVMNPYAVRLGLSFDF
jgi:hypothetical protein